MEIDARAALGELTTSLNSAKNALRLDENRDWRIKGRFGHIYATAGRIGGPTELTYQIYVSTRSPRAWGFAKKALAFMPLTNDGDDEGVFWLNRQPNAKEAAAIRQYVGIHQTTPGGFTSMQRGDQPEISA